MITALTQRSPEYAQPDLTPRRVEPQYLIDARRNMEAAQKQYDLDCDNPLLPAWFLTWENDTVVWLANDQYRQAWKQYNDGFQVVVASQPLEVVVSA